MSLESLFMGLLNIAKGVTESESSGESFHWDDLTARLSYNTISYKAMSASRLFLGKKWRGCTLLYAYQIVQKSRTLKYIERSVRYGVGGENARCKLNSRFCYVSIESSWGETKRTLTLNYCISRLEVYRQAQSSDERSSNNHARLQNQKGIFCSVLSLFPSTCLWQMMCVLVCGESQLLIMTKIHRFRCGIKSVLHQRRCLEFIRSLYHWVMEARVTTVAKRFGKQF